MPLKTFGTFTAVYIESLTVKYETLPVEIKNNPRSVIHHVQAYNMWQTLQTARQTLQTAI